MDPVVGIVFRLAQEAGYCDKYMSMLFWLGNVDLLYWALLLAFNERSKLDWWVGQTDVRHAVCIEDSRKIIRDIYSYCVFANTAISFKWLQGKLGALGHIFGKPLSKFLFKRAQIHARFSLIIEYQDAQHNFSVPCSLFVKFLSIWRGHRIAFRER